MQLNVALLPCDVLGCDRIWIGLFDQLEDLLRCQWYNLELRILVRNCGA